MAKKLKFPGLQQRFEDASIRLLLERQQPLKARELIDLLQKRPREFEISPEEADDLNNNFANYAARAKEAGVIRSGGPWRGYELVDAEAAKARVTREPTSRPSEEDQITGDETAMPEPGRRNQHYESLLHLPATVALSGEFSSRVWSLPNASDSVRWGNPDMLMLRSTALSDLRDYDRSLAPDLFKLIDVTPECILSSIELKIFLSRGRSTMFSAVAETAANSRWANEAWLVFLDRTASSDPLDDDIVSLARSVEVGLIELYINEEHGGIDLKVHAAATPRATLRLAELKKERGGVLREAQALLQHWNDSKDPTFLDVEYANHKARVLVEQGVENLRRQKGFSRDDSMKELLEQFGTTKEERLFVTKLTKGSLQAAAQAATLVDDRPLERVLTDSADDEKVKKQADIFRSEVAALSGSAWE
jgi:hypothetical protein